jgi:hypothetical protein
VNDSLYGSELPDLFEGDAAFGGHGPPLCTQGDDSRLGTQTLSMDPKYSISVQKIPDLDVLVHADALPPSSLLTPVQDHAQCTPAFSSPAPRADVYRPDSPPL